MVELLLERVLQFALGLLRAAPLRDDGILGRRERLAGGFHNISGGAVDLEGNFYFVDARWQRIHRWSWADRRLTTVSDAPIQPVNVAFDHDGNLLVVSYAGSGTLFSIAHGKADSEPTLVAPQPAAARLPQRRRKRQRST